MPEYPDLTVYVEALEAQFVGHTLNRVRLASPFVLRTHEPPLSAVFGQTLRGVSRLGKRLVLGFDAELYLVVHLMIAGRLRAKPPGTAVPNKVGLLAFDFPEQTLLLTEASPKKRASLHVIRGREALAAMNPGGLEPFAISVAEFGAQLRAENHTLKRSLTDPHLFAAIGNAYSDEILHRARLSPVLLTSRIDDAQVARLYQATHEVLREWTGRLRAEANGRFPDKVTAFHDAMAVHGRYGKPCPVCGGRVQRIRRSANEANYCPNCQTDGKLLADRSLSRLLHDDWPATAEELEEQKRVLRENSPTVPKVKPTKPRRKPPA
ncbi:MAG TPA: DNA-formamidopyrimidine glycosylase family protein [Polyangiales bacterium]